VYVSSTALNRSTLDRTSTWRAYKTHDMAPTTPLLEYLTTHEPLFRPSRLPSLYSDLSVQRTSNPEGYAANTTAWAAALVRASLAGRLPPEQDLNLLVLNTGDALLDALASRTYGRPSGLGCVLDEMVRSERFVEQSTFMTKEQGIYDKGWASWVPSPWSVVRWGLRQAGILGGSFEARNGGLKSGKLVMVPALEEMWRTLQPFVDGLGNALPQRVMARDTFAKEVKRLLSVRIQEDEGANHAATSQSSISDQDLQILLRYLSRDKKVLSYDNITIKFKPTAQSSAPEPITQEDRSIASLKSLIQDLQQQTTALSDRISSLQQDATTAIKNKNKPSALSALRRKKLAERTLQTRLDTLAQLEEIFSKIESAVSQVEVLQVMESSSSVLKHLNKQIGGVERVEDVLDSLREEVSKVDEVSGVLGEVGAVDPKAVLDEADVDGELEAMEREEKARVAKIEEEKLKERMKELDALEQLRKQKQRLEEEDKRKAEERDKELEASLSSSVERLRKLDIDGQQQSQDEGFHPAKQVQRESEPVQEGAS
jgi:charged multivesicular body protein 7